MKPPSDRSIFALGLIVLLFGLLLLPAIGRAHDHFAHWLSKFGTKCCSDLGRECRPVRSYWDDERERFVIFYNDGWHPVPARAVLADQESPDGASYACLHLLETGEVVIDCFVNGKPKG